MSYFLNFHFRKIVDLEMKYLTKKISIDEMMDNAIHFFQSWKKAKYDKIQSNINERQLLDHLDTQDPQELDEANEGEDPLDVSEEEEESDIENEPQDDVFTCGICCLPPEEWRNIQPCGHMFCLPCCEKFKLLTGLCGQCKTPIKELHKSFPNMLFITRGRKAKSGEKSEEERRRENAVQMRRLSRLPEEEGEEEEDEVAGAENAEEDEDNHDPGKLVIIYLQLFKIILVCSTLLFSF